MKLLLFIRQLGTEIWQEFGKSDDPKRFALDSAPAKWHNKKRKAGSNLIYNPTGKRIPLRNNAVTWSDMAMVDQDCDLEQPVAQLTERDVKELLSRGLDPNNRHYLTAKGVYANNPGVTRGELQELINSVSVYTWQKVLAAFRAARRDSGATNGQDTDNS